MSAPLCDALATRGEGGTLKEQGCLRVCLTSNLMCLPCRDTCTRIAPGTIASILKGLPKVLARIQRQHSAFLADAMSAVVRLSRRLLHGSATPKHKDVHPGEGYTSRSVQTRVAQQQAREEPSAARLMLSSSAVAHGLCEFLIFVWQAVQAWPEAQKQRGRRMAADCGLEIAAMTATLPEMNHTNISRLPRQQAAALLEPEVIAIIRNQVKWPLPPGSPREIRKILDACNALVYWSESSQGRAPKGSQWQETKGRGAGSDSDEAAEVVSSSTSESSVMQLGRAAILHGILAKGESVSSGTPEAPEPFHGVPSCIQALLQAASEHQAKPFALSLAAAPGKTMLVLHSLQFEQ